MAPAPPPVPVRFPCWCRAVYSWGGESKRDLGFIEGDLIECLNAGDGSWWVGRLYRDRRSVGSFPSNFVEVLPADFRPTTKSVSPLPDSNTPSPKNGPQKSKTFRKPFEAYAKAPHYTTAKQPEVFREVVKPRQRDNSAQSFAKGSSPDDISQVPSPAPSQLRHHNSTAHSHEPASSHHYGSRAPSPAPTLTRQYDHRAVSPAPTLTRQYDHRAVSPAPTLTRHHDPRAPSPAPPLSRHHDPRAPSPAPPVSRHYDPRAVSPAPPLARHHDPRAPSPAPPLARYHDPRAPSPAPSFARYHDPRATSPAPTLPHHHDPRAPSPAPTFDQYHDPRAPSPAPTFTNYHSRGPSPAPSFHRHSSFVAESVRSDSPPPPPPPHRHVAQSNNKKESTEFRDTPYDLSRHGSNGSYAPYNPYVMSRQNSHASYHEPAALSRNNSHASYNQDRYIDNAGHHTPRAVSPHPEISHLTPSPLREAMDGVMEQLGELQGFGRSEDVDTTEQPLEPWGPDSFGSVQSQSRGRTREHAARPVTSMGLPGSDEGYETWSGGSSQEASFSHGNQGKSSQLPELSNYVDRMEKRFRALHKNNPKIPSEAPDDDMPPPPPPKGPSIERPKSSMGSFSSSSSAPRRKLRARKSAYEIGQGISRTFTTKTNSTQASTGNQSHTSSSTQSSGRTLWSGASASGFSSTSAGSMARNHRRSQSAFGTRDSEAERPDSPFTGVTYHSSHATNAQATARPPSQASFHNESGLGGLVQPKAPKRNIFKKIFESARTGVATGRGSLAGGTLGGERARANTLGQSLPLGSSPMTGIGNPHMSRDTARDMGLGGGVDWVQVRRDVNRSNSLSKNERSERKERCQMLDHPTLNPVDELYEAVEGDEGADGSPVIDGINYQAINLSQVDKNSRFISGLPPLTTSITLATMYVCRPYRSDVQRLRGIFTWVAEKICWEEDFEGDIDTRQVIQSKKACAEEYAVLVMEMCNAIGIHCEIVRGYLKAPGEVADLNMMPRPNHWWNAVVVDNEWRIIDCCLASPSNPRRGQYSSAPNGTADPFWFLARPLEACWTHVPDHHDQQHIVPPVAHETLLNLPCTTPAFFREGIEMVDYNTSMNRIEDLEMVHIKFNVPADVEIAAEVETRAFSRDSDGDLFESGDSVTKRALAQAEWFNGVKRYTIKALLPGDEGQGKLKIYAGKRGLMHSIKDIPHPLAFTLPIIHTGENPPYDFVTRHPTPHAQRHDIYVVQPQCQKLALNNTFVFAIRQHPSSLSSGAQSSLTPSSNPGGTSPVPFMRPGSAMSMTASISGTGSNPSSASGTVAGKKPAKLAIQTPGGKILRLMRKEDRKGISVGSRVLGNDDDISDGGTWETIIKCSEKGLWRGLVLADRTARWSWILVRFNLVERLSRDSTRQDTNPLRFTLVAALPGAGEHHVLLTQAQRKLDNRQQQQQQQHHQANYSPAQQYAPQPSSYQGHSQFQAQQLMYHQPQQLQSLPQQQPQPQPQQRQQNPYAQPQVFQNQQLPFDFNNGFQQPQIPGAENPWAYNNVSLYGNGSVADGGLGGSMQMQVDGQYMASPNANVMWQQKQLQQPDQMRHQSLPHASYNAGVQSISGPQSRTVSMPSASQVRPQNQIHQMGGKRHQSLQEHQSPTQAHPQIARHASIQHHGPTHSPISPQASSIMPQQRQLQPGLVPTPGQYRQHPQQPYQDPRQAQTQQQQVPIPRRVSASSPLQQQPRPRPQAQQRPAAPQPTAQPTAQQHPQPISQPSSRPHPQATPEPQTPVSEHQFQTPAQPQMQFVNLQDIQKTPLTPSTSAINTQVNYNLASSPVAQSMSVSRKSSNDFPRPSQGKAPPQSMTPQGIRKSASQSPAMTASRLSSKSPAISSKAAPHTMTPAIICLAEELISKARSMAPTIASTLNSADVEEYQKLIGTGLACLETALQSQGLSPRHEARLRLRYAVVLQEETENLMEAETTLSKGITLCDKHRMLDLKYCMQHSMMKVLFQRNRKAALKAMDQHIKDCDAYQHVHWSYAFRLLKASFYMEAGNAADATALDNLRGIQSYAHHRGDAAFSVFASLTEALVLLKTSKGSPEMIQNCMAQAAKYQLDPSVQIPQLELFSLLVGFLTSLHRQKHEDTVERLRALQKKIDSWQDPRSKADFRLPVKKHIPATQTISKDTSAIICPGAEDADSDYLVVSFMSQMESTLLVFALGGLTYLHKPSSSGKNQSHELWRQGLRVLSHWDTSSSGTISGPPAILSQAVKQKMWRTDMQCFLNILLGLLAASQCRWDVAMKHAETAESHWHISTKQEMLKAYLIYLKGACHQGTGCFDAALNYFRDDSLAIEAANPAPKAPQRHLALLAAMNQLWIMQRPSHQDDSATVELINELDPLCRPHPNIEIRGTWQSVLAAVVTNPPRQRNQRKEDAGQALSNIKGNILATTIGLVIARDLLYNNLLGEQAWKCMQAAATWAGRSGNPLWQSVVDGIIAEFSDARNEKEQSRKFWERGVEEARNAFARSS
ncbi:unnamed protein product [Clonostachys rosea]|uniref:SH3 domain-containing protein n=1 Tax=Bionectria ochroleuca TaxID=29856 RepID=A0ABY6V3I2_BIOOC|nr:unnamed protein product [Clonostachys rosea]